MSPAYAAFLLTCAGLATREPETPRPLPDDRDPLCDRECYMFKSGCPGKCRMLHERNVVIVEPAPVDPVAHAYAIAQREAYEAERAAKKAQAEADRIARAESERIANTPAKTLRRRARLAARAKR